MATPPAPGPPREPRATTGRKPSRGDGADLDDGRSDPAGDGERRGRGPAGGRRESVLSSAPGWLARGFAARFGIDPRALAAFRIGLGSLVVSDLLFRARGIGVFYSDAGVLPRAAHAEVFPSLARVSVHTLTGSTGGQALLFALGACVALAMTVGYRTRLATAGTLALHASLYARNPYILNGGDGLLALALFLGVFLPLGARWSVDAVSATRRGEACAPWRWHDRSTRRAAPDTRVLGLATVTVLLQLVVVYTANALFKHRSDAWMSGQAVRYVLELEQFSVLLGPSLTAYPELLVAVNWLWVGMLWAASLLVLATGRLRVAVVAAFLAAHLGMLVTMRLGLFPLVVAAILLVYLPTPVWDSVENLVAAASLDDRLAGAARELLERMPANSWRPDTRWGPDLRQVTRRIGRRVAVVVLAAVLVTSVLWPAAALGAADGTPAERVVDADDYAWTLFAPNTPTHTVWYVAPVTLASGDEIDALDGGPVAWSAPADAADTYPSPLWHRYLSELRWAGEAEHRPLATYLCREAARVSGGEPTEVALFALRRPIPAVGGGDVERHEVFRAACPGGG